MGVFDQHKIFVGRQSFEVDGKKISMLCDDREEFRALYHVTHLPAAKYLMESLKVRPEYVQNGKLLNGGIKVIWLSPNTWADGSLYGNVRFSYSLDKIFTPATNFYAVEVINKYNPGACRILITLRDHDTNPSLERYDPYIQYDGPWHIDNEGRHYRHRNLNLEFMFEDELDLDEASKIDFVKHHPNYCNMTSSGDCQYKGKSSEYAEMVFVSHLIANDIVLKNLNLQMTKNDEVLPLLDKAQLAEKILGRLNNDAAYNGSGQLPVEVNIQACKAILDLFGKEKFDKAQFLKRLFPSPETLSYSMKQVFGNHFEVNPDDLDSEKITRS